MAPGTFIFLDVFTVSSARFEPILGDADSESAVVTRPEVRVVRAPYEEPHHAHIRIAATNGVFSGEVDVYCSVSDLLEIARALARFPTQIPDAWEFVYGSSDPAAHVARFCLMQARTIDTAGHCALHFEFNLNEEEPNDGRAEFSIPVEPWALASLGRLFEELHQNPSGEFRWTPTHGAVTT